MAEEKPERPPQAGPGGAPLSKALKAAGQELKHDIKAVSPKAADVVEALDPWGVREMFQHPGRLFWINFLAGLFRGLGFTIGMTALGGLLLTWAVRFVKPMLQIPVVGHYAAEIVETVEKHLETGHPEKDAKPEVPPAPAVPK